MFMQHKGINEEEKKLDNTFLSMPFFFFFFADIYYFSFTPSLRDRDDTVAIGIVLKIRACENIKTL